MIGAGQDSAVFATCRCDEGTFLMSFCLKGGPLHNRFLADGNWEDVQDGHTDREIICKISPLAVMIKLVAEEYGP